MTAALAQRELKLAPECPVCGRPAGDRQACPEGFCYFDQVLWNGSPERVDALPLPKLLDAVRAGLAGEPGGRKGLQEALQAFEAPARAEAITTFVARRRAELAGAEAKAARKAAADDEGKLEAEVQEEVCKALHKLAENGRLHYERINAGGHYNDQGQYVRSAATGIADVLCWVKVERPRQRGGKVVFAVGLALECKRPGGKQSEGQRKWEERFRKRSGGYYALVTSAAEAIAAVGLASRLEGPRHG